MVRGTRWTVKFEEDGGYDSMSAAYDILADGRVMMRVDVADFVRDTAQQKAKEAHESHPDPRSHEARSLSERRHYEIMHAEDEGAATLAYFIVNALNLHGM